MGLVVSNVVRRYAGADHATLDGLSFDLEPGTLTSLLGKSGSGKSTLLRCLVGLEPFERGEIVVDGVTVKGTEVSSPNERAVAIAQVRSRVGFVFQGFELFPHLTALDNCTLAPLQVRRESRAGAEARAKALLDQLGLADKAHLFPEALSGGQRQRVAIARALAMEPKILLYDEPTSALDPSLKFEVLEALRRVDATGVTQLVVTHDLGLSRETEHVCVLDGGRIIERGEPKTVLSTPAHSATRALLAGWN